MFEENTNLSPDLEWMLQSGQVDEGTLLEALARQYYQLIYHYTLSKLTYPEAAHRAAQDTFIHAITKTKNYRSETSIADWLVTIAHGICQTRLALLDNHLFLNPKLIKSILLIRTDETLTHRQIERAILKMKAQLSTNRTAKSRWVGYQELGLIAIAIMAIVIVLQSINLAFPTGDQPQSGNKSTSLLDFPRILFEAASSPGKSKNNDSLSFTPGGIPVQAPLNLQSSHEDIWRRMLLSRYLWETLWVEVWVILRGPADYIGPPRAERHQLWLSHNQGGLHLSGLLDSNPERMERITSTSLGPEPTTFLFGIEDYSRLGSQIPWFYLSSDTISSIPYMTNFFFIADYDFPPNRLQYRVIDEQTWADRSAVVVEISDYRGVLQAHLWLDSLTGIALREQFFGADSTNSIRLETSVAKIEFDVDFPDNIYQSIPIVDGDIFFAQNIYGKPESPADRPVFSKWQALSSRMAPPLSLPPDGFDPSLSQLTFAAEDDEIFPFSEYAKVQIFANDYYLGKIELFDPLRMNCARSPDGRWIVISQWPDSFVQFSSSIVWYDLKDLRPTEVTIPETLITRLAFSPDNRYIAAAGINQNSGKSKLYLVETETGDKQVLPEIKDVWSLTWSPDGKQLASLNWPSFRMYTQSTLRINVYDLKQDKVLSFVNNADFPWGLSSIEIPLGDWEANFPLTMSGLESCALPPGS